MHLADHSSRGVLLTGVCECDREASIMRRHWPRMEGPLYDDNDSSNSNEQTNKLTTWSSLVYNTQVNSESGTP